MFLVVLVPVVVQKVFAVQLDESQLAQLLDIKSLCHINMQAAFNELCHMTSALGPFILAKVEQVQLFAA